MSNGSSTQDPTKDFGILSEAIKITSPRGERHDSYGDAKDNHETTALLWSAYLSRCLGREVTVSPRMVCILNILQKASRDAHRPKKDNLVDMAGWARNAELCGDDRDDIRGPDNPRKIGGCPVCRESVKKGTIDVVKVIPPEDIVKPLHSGYCIVCEYRLTTRKNSDGEFVCHYCAEEAGGAS